MLSTPGETLPKLILYFQIHQPRRLKHFSFFDIGRGEAYFDDDLNRDIIRRISENCYLPTNRMLGKLISAHPDVKINFSISGTALDQMALYAPEALRSFQSLASTGSVEFFAETSHHSLAALFSEQEFAEQLSLHRSRIAKLFNQYPRVGRNTELIYNDRVGELLAKAGAECVLAEVKALDGTRHNGELFTHPQNPDLRIMLRSNSLSDAISFRYTEGGRQMKLKNYLKTLYAAADKQELILLGLDYETFGEHYKPSTGIIDFLHDFLLAIDRDKRVTLVSAGDVADSVTPLGPLAVSGYTSWADESKDLSAWLGNDLQKGAFSAMRALERRIKNAGRNDLLEDWRHLQTSDHFYYMCTKGAADGEVHAYFSPYINPYEAYINFMNVIKDLETKLSRIESALHLDETSKPFVLSSSI
jgi:alpha-amylase